MSAPPRSMMRLAKRRIKSALRPFVSQWTRGSELSEAVLQLGVRPGGMLLVHNSLSALGYTPGGAKAVIESLMRAIGPDGTLVMPAHTWEWMDAGERTFDARTTPSCVGVIAERFRCMPQVVRSLHPTHSVAAFGPQAESLASGHEEASSPCGEGTPYMRLLRQGGQILLLGVGLESNTAFHTIEALADVPYLLMPAADDFTLIDRRGVSHAVRLRRHVARVPRRFPETQDYLLTSGVMKRTMMGSVSICLLEGESFLDKMLQAVLSDRLLLLSQEAGEAAELRSA